MSQVIFRRFGLTILLAATSNAQVPINNLPDLQKCIDGTLAGYTNVCPLAPGVYNVKGTVNEPQIVLSRSNVTVLGGSTRSNYVLKRDSASVAQIIKAAAGVSGYTLRDITVDGNRFGVGLGLNCLGPNANYWDVDLSSSGTASLSQVNIDMRNSPGTALLAGGYVAVEYSRFSPGGLSQATRSTALWLEGYRSFAKYNEIYAAGTAGINVHGTEQIIYWNSLGKNRYEMPDGSGGQLFVDPSSRGAFIAANVINGDYWSTNTGTSLATGCQAFPGSHYPAGVEGYGNDHGFYNNQVMQHTGTGVEWKSVTNVVISGNNPWSAADPPRYIKNNVYRGIWFETPYGPNAGIILDHVRVTDNNDYAIWFDSTTTGLGFINNACINGNQFYIGPSGLTNPYPGNPNICP